MKKIRGGGGVKERVKRGGCIRDRQRGEMRVFSFHYIGSLKRMEGGVGWGGGGRGEGRGGKKCPCQSGSLWRCREACGCHPPAVS